MSAESQPFRLQPLAAEFIRGTVGGDFDAGRTVVTLGSADAWRSEVATVVGDIDEGVLLIILLPNRSLARRVLTILSQGRRGSKAPSPRRVCRYLGGMGYGAESTHRIWPTSEAARMVVPYRPLRATSYVQRAGLIGGGGRRLWARVIARSSLATWLMHVLAPAVAVVVRKQNGA